MWKKRKYTTAEHPYCRNCHYPLARDAKYCHKCGQKNSTGRITFGMMVSEFMEATFNLDSKIYKTIFHLPIPGRLTTEYFKGRHKRYVHPVRLVLIIFIAFLAVASIYINYNQINRTSDSFIGHESFIKYEFLVELDSTVQALKLQQPNRQAQEALDSIHRYIQFVEADLDIGDSLDLEDDVTFMNERTPNIARKDFHDLDDDELFEKYGSNLSFWDGLLLQQKIKLSRDPSELVRFLVGNTTWMIFLMIPLFALVLKLFYIFRNHYYVEHFVFTTHMHAFGLGLLLIWVILYKWHDNPDNIGLVFIFWIIYIILSMKNYYQQTWFWTFLKFGFAAAAYFAVLAIAATFTILISILLF